MATSGQCVSIISTLCPSISGGYYFSDGQWRYYYASGQFSYGDRPPGGSIYCNTIK
ncbi:MAG: hypothetical protein WBK47_06135 [Acetomicrobium sp.]